MNHPKSKDIYDEKTGYDEAKKSCDFQDEMAAKNRSQILQYPRKHYGYDGENKGYVDGEGEFEVQKDNRMM